jgi:hypothetical protein
MSLPSEDHANHEACALSNSKTRSGVDDQVSGRESSPAPLADIPKWRFQPFERDHVAGNDAATLCAKCRRIDFQAIFSIRRVGLVSRPVVDIGPGPDIEQAGLTCTFCLFLLPY